MRRKIRLSIAVWAVLGSIWLLDRYAGLQAPPHREAFLGIILAIVSAIWSGVEAVGTYIGFALEYVVHVMWITLIDLGKTVGDGLWTAARWTGRAFDAVKVAWDKAISPFLKWAYKKLNTLELWAKEKMAPVFRFLESVKTHIDDFYKTFIKPITDTIDFIRQVNRVLLAFHIAILQALDSTLAQIEQRIEDPFLWVHQKITWLEGWIDRIVTLDGLLQRITLLKSMAAYAPAWVNGFWNTQIDKTIQSGDEYSRTRDYPLDSEWANGKELAQFYRGEASRMDGRIPGLVAIWRVASTLDAPPPDEF